MAIVRRSRTSRRAATLNYGLAIAFIAGVPDGYWTSYADVVAASGNRSAARHMGNGGAFETTSLMVVLEATVRDPAEGAAPN